MTGIGGDLLQVSDFFGEDVGLDALVGDLVIVVCVEGFPLGAIEEDIVIETEHIEGSDAGFVEE